MRKGALLVFIFLTGISFSQNIDSLKLALKNAKHDTVRCIVLNAMIEAEVNDEIWPKYNEQLKVLAEKNIAGNAEPKNFYLKHLAAAFNNNGYLSNAKGDVQKALGYFSKSLKIQEKIGDKLGIANSLFNLGEIYQGQGDIPKALEYYNKSLKIHEEIGYKQGVASTLNNIGLIYDDRGDLPKALEFFNKSLKIQEKIQNKGGIAYSLNNIGGIYKNQGNIPKAIEYLSRSLKFREEIGDKKGIAQSLNNMANLTFKNGQVKEALAFASRGMQIAKELGYPASIKYSARALKTIYLTQNKFKEAFEMYELEILMRDSINSEETKKASIKTQLKYEYEKKAATEAVRVEEEKKVVAVQLQQEKARRYALYGGLVLVGLFAIFMVNRFRVTNKQKKVIEAQKKMVEEQKHVVDEKQKEILDSIHYAKRIQTALLPSEKYIERTLNGRN